MGRLHVQRNVYKASTGRFLADPPHTENSTDKPLNRMYSSIALWLGGVLASHQMKTEQRKKQCSGLVDFFLCVVIQPDNCNALSSTKMKIIFYCFIVELLTHRNRQVREVAKDSKLKSCKSRKGKTSNIQHRSSSWPEESLGNFWFKTEYYCFTIVSCFQVFPEVGQ